MTRAAPKDEGAEARRLVACVYVAVNLLGHEDPPRVFMESLLRAAGPLALVIRLEVVAAITARWPEIDRMYAAKVIRDLCRGTCAVSDGWRLRLEALAGGAP